MVMRDPFNADSIVKSARLQRAFCAQFRGVCAECPENQQRPGHSRDTPETGLRLPPFADLAIAALANCVKLTSREHEVLVLCCSGLKNQTIAATLGISASAVRRHLRNLHKKTNTADKAELILNLWHASRACVEATSVRQDTSSRRSKQHRSSTKR
jgi:DNA-binding NarL/FixJ family response regulator